MPTPKTEADLITESSFVIGSQVNPSSITPTTAEGFFEDWIVSGFNKKDGISCAVVGFDGVFVDIPAVLAPSVHNGMKLKDWQQAIMNQIKADHDSITGGVQGLQGEFLANITAETNQIIVNNVGGSFNVYRTVIPIKLPNDKDGGCFDNGNNWLIDRFFTPAGGQNHIFYKAFGFSFTLLVNNCVANVIRRMKLVICNNGTPLAGAESNEILIDENQATGTRYYFDDFQTAELTGGTATLAGDEITLELWDIHNINGQNESAVIKMDFGNFYNELV